MKNTRLTFIGILFTIGLFTLNSCAKVDNPVKPAIDLDTTLFPGNWVDYIYPNFDENTNTQRNVLLEDYTGHRCPGCPAAAVIAEGIEAANPNEVFSVAIHASTTGLSNLQDVMSTCGTPSNPLNEFCDVLFCNEGIEYGWTFGSSNVGFVTNPYGTINREAITSQDFFYFHSDWVDLTNTVLTENNLRMNIQAKSNYYPETNGLFLHTEIETLEDLSGGSYSTVVYVVENEFVGWQDEAGVYLEDYHHHNILRGCIDGLPWGQSITGDLNSGSKFKFDYSYELPTGVTNDDYHLLVYVYDVASYEILQVIKHEF